jgi:hypothetical protein
MRRHQIKEYLAYWLNSNSVALAKIKSLDDMATARRFCSVMRLGKFRNVSDRSLFNALVEFRAETGKGI